MIDTSEIAGVKGERSLIQCAKGFQDQLGDEVTMRSVAPAVIYGQWGIRAASSDVDNELECHGHRVIHIHTGFAIPGSFTLSQCRSLVAVLLPVPTFKSTRRSKAFIAAESAFRDWLKAPRTK